MVDFDIESTAIDKITFGLLVLGVCQDNKKYWVKMIFYMLFVCATLFFVCLFVFTVKSKMKVCIFTGLENPRD